MFFAAAFAGAASVTEIPLSLQLRGPEDVTATRGQSVTLRCDAESSSGPVQITWLHNDIPLVFTTAATNDSNSNRKYYVQQGDGSLYFPKVGGKRGGSGGLAGQYRCLVKNSVGSLLSNPAKLRIASE